MSDLRVGTAQFEHRNDDKAYNLARIAELTRRAVERGAQVVSFHECAVTGYTFLQRLTEEQLRGVAEPVPDGPSTRRLIEIAREYRTVVMAGLIERAADGRLYKCYVAVGPDGFIAKYHKLHPFIHPALTPGAGHVVIDLLGWKAGFLICYDNNLPENVRCTTLLGAEVIFMPHVTGCTPNPAPGRGAVSRELWDNREKDPARLRMEFRGPKGREWLLRWLPTRCFENGVYGVFSNPIGVDDDTVKPGLAMIIDPFGEILVESGELGDDVVVATLTKDKIGQASGRRYIRARRPELYGKLTEPKPAGESARPVPAWRDMPK